MVRTKKILSIFLSLIMLLSLMPMTGISAVAYGDSEVMMGSLEIGSVINRERQLNFDGYTVKLSGGGSYRDDLMECITEDVIIWQPDYDTDSGIYDLSVANDEEAEMIPYYLPWTEFSMENALCWKIVDKTDDQITLTGSDEEENLIQESEVSGDVDLSVLDGYCRVGNGAILTGTLAGNKRITVEDGATITLRDAVITSLNGSAQYAGITLLGDATIVLEGTNKVKGGHEDYPGIYVPVGKTLTIDGEGSLEASSGAYGAGIGGGFGLNGGSIIITGGTIMANGGAYAAGIGGGNAGTCGNITITGGTVTATGGQLGPGIGGGAGGSCGDITIADTVTKVVATAGRNNTYSIGASSYNGSTCGTVTIKGVVGAITTSPYTVEGTPVVEPTENVVDLSALTGDYEAKDGDVLTGTLAGNKKITVADGATVTLRDADITSLVNDEEVASYAGITLLGDAKILLEGTNKAKGGFEDYPGIFVPEGKTLTIDGTGSLEASSNGYGAGIGGGYNMASGNIVIDGGTITANGGDYGAGIGGDRMKSCGDITIHGGTVIATAGYGAAGIGGGETCSCGNILIDGGTITATGGEGAAGIGSGEEGSCGNILISGGTITANGGEYGSGIGSGYEGSCGTVTIEDTVTKVVATAGSGNTYSIGAGRNGTCGTVTIQGVEGAITTSPYTVEGTPVVEPIDLSTLTGDYEAKDGDVLTGTLAGNKKITVADGATVTLRDANITIIKDEDEQDSYAGITLLGDAKILLEGTNKVKCGYANYPGIFVPDGKTLTIDGTGSLEASASDQGAGIGGGNAMNGNIVIDGGTITATGGGGAAGIGSGATGSGGDITINGGTITANGGESAAGIGVGASGSGGKITINGGTITANGGKKAAGIGGCEMGSCGDITINGGTVTANGGQYGSGIGSGEMGSCGTITINGGTITANGGQLGSGIGSADGGFCGNITITGGTIEATGGDSSAGIGCGHSGFCGKVTIANTVTKVTATAGKDNAYSIGAAENGYCDTVTVMGVEGAITTSPYTVDNTPVVGPSGYLQTTNADIEESLMWNVFFHIDGFDTLVNPKITVGCAADAKIDGAMYGLTYDEERDAYMITVPIRHRLIGQAVSFSLSDDNGSYQLGLGARGELSDAVAYSFDQYLSEVKEIAGYGDIVDALRAYSATLLEKWPVEG